MELMAYQLVFFIWFVLLSINSRYVSIEFIILITPSVVLLLHKNLKIFYLLETLDLIYCQV